MSPKRIVTRLILPALAVIAAAGLLAPYLSAAQFRERIRVALERSLHRRVSVGAAHYDLFHGPGFEVQDVLIDDVPAAAPEPFAYVGSLQATLRLASFWTGRLSFSTLRLNDSTINLVKTSAGPWNVQQFLTAVPAPSSGAAVPDIEIRSARFNFKFADTKSVFYLNNADLDVYPAAGGAIGIRFSGEPARTDRGAQGFGGFSARGLLHPGPAGADRLSLGLQIEHSNLAELITLFAGRDLGIHGTAIASAHLDGPLSALAIKGDLTIGDVHRWDLMPAQGEGWPASFRGRLNLPAQSLHLETTAPAGQPPPPLSVSLDLDGFLASPRLAFSAALHDLPAGPVAGAARHFGAPIPDDLALDGALNGVLSYSNSSGWSGAFTLANGSFSLAGRDHPSATLSAASLSLQGPEAALAPTALAFPGGQSLDLSATYNLVSHNLALHLQTPRFSISQTRSRAIPLLETLPLLSRLRDGSWNGSADFVAADGVPGVWSGKLELLSTEISLPDFAVPLHIASAALAFDEDRLQLSRLHARLGKTRFDADLRYDPAAARPLHLRLAVPELDLQDLDRAAAPLLQSSEGLLARLRIRRAPAPDWVRSRHLDASFDIASLTAAGIPLGSLQGRFAWDGAALVFSPLDWTYQDAEGSGRLAVSLGGPPQFRLSGRVDRLPWRGGTLSFNGSLNASGSGLALLRSAAAEGDFSAASVLLAPDAPFDQIAGAFRLSSAELHLDNLQASQGPDSFTGQGASQPDGRILLELSSVRRQLRQLTAGLHLSAPAEPR